MVTIRAKITDNPKLKQKRLKDEDVTLCLELYLGGEFTPKREINFLEYFKQYISEYQKKDIRNIQLAYNRFSEFLRESAKYCQFADNIAPEEITKDLVLDFTEFLKRRCRGTGAHAAFARFKKVVAYATEHEIFNINPCGKISIPVDEEALVKDVLTNEEIERLVCTHYDRENGVVRRAFIFCLYTGLRWCDVKELTFRNIDFSRKHLVFDQHKTKGHSARSRVDNPLTDYLIELVGMPQRTGWDELIFPLPSSTTCAIHLKKWVQAAGINKHITWHCARHSFAVNILNNNANIKTVASLLGHSGLRHTEKYTRAVDRLKEEAVNSLPLFVVFP